MSARVLRFTPRSNVDREVLRTIRASSPLAQAMADTDWRRIEQRLHAGPSPFLQDLLAILAKERREGGAR